MWQGDVTKIYERATFEDRKGSPKHTFQMRWRIGSQFYLRLVQSRIFKSCRYGSFHDKRNGCREHRRHDQTVATVISDTIINVAIGTRAVPANTAAIPTTANAAGLKLAPGINLSIAKATHAPTIPPM